MKHPMQYIKDHRFVENELVRFMVDEIGLNRIASMDFDNDDYDQILQLIGYSTSGIPYRDKTKYEITDAEGVEPERIFEDKYKELKDSLRPIMSELYNVTEEDML